VEDAGEPHPLSDGSHGTALEVKILLVAPSISCHHLLAVLLAVAVIELPSAFLFDVFVHS
jgi:hypothetical protein